MRHAKVRLNPNVITPEEALRQGLTGGFLRTVANSLERIAKSLPASASVQYVKDTKGNEAMDPIYELTNFNPLGNMNAAYDLRKVAKVVDRARKGF